MRLSYLVILADGCEVGLRTRRRILIGDTISVWAGRGYISAKVTGFGWEGNRFAVHATEVAS